MANPQKENGYTPIANEILDNLVKLSLNGTQLRILLVLWRYTYGFSRKEHDLSLSFLSSNTGCDVRQLQRELKALEKMNIIYQKIKSGAYRIIGFNKDYEKWQRVGENTIGESTNGEITNGESTNGTIGESTKGSIGEFTNQDKQKTKYKTNISAHQKIINYFFEKYKEKLGTKYIVNGKVDGATVKRMLSAGLTEEYMTELIDWYFETDDEFIKSAGYTINKLQTFKPKFDTWRATKPRSKYKDLTGEYK